MKTFCLLLVLSFVMPSHRPMTNDAKPVEQPVVILKTFDSFLSYYGQYVKLESDFAALDESSHVVTKDAFLKLMTTGKYLPLRLQSKSAEPVYQLYKLNPSISSRITECLKGWAADYYSKYSKLGKPLPQFSFVDINGNTYTNANTRGRILVLKGWDLSCPPCIREIPELNKLVDKYHDRKDIVFVSMVPEDENKVKSFLAQHPFSYPVVARQPFFQNVLQLSFVPCHIVVNKDGNVACVTFSVEELEGELAKETKS